MWSSPLEVKSNNLLLGRDLTIYAWNANILPFRINSLPTISALKFNGALTMAVGTSTGQVNMFQLETSLLSYCFRGVYITGNTHSSVHCVTRLWGITVWPAWRGYSDCRVLSGPWETLLLAPMVGLRDSQAEAAVGLCLVSSWLWFRAVFSWVCGTEFCGKTKIWNSPDSYLWGL